LKGTGFSPYIEVPQNGGALAREEGLETAPAMTGTSGQVYMELWVSLASLLRSYTAAHGLNGNRQATVELGEERITVRHGDAWLELNRRGPQITWRRDDKRSGMLELTEAGRLRKGEHEEEMDMAAEAWARELMHEQ
jgi:hypothetical protein